MAQGKRIKKKEKKGIGAGTVAVIVLAAVVVLAVGAVVGLGAYVNGLDTVFPNITVGGVDIGGMSYDAAHSTLLNANLGVPAGVKATVKLTDGVSVSVSSDEAGLTYSVTNTVDAAYAYGRDGGFFADMFTWLDCLRHPHDMYIASQFNESGVRAIVAAQAAQANHGPTDAVWSVDSNEIVVTKGVESYTVDEEGVFNFIRDTLLSGVSAETDEFSEEKTGGELGAQPDFDALYDELYREPQNAVYDPATGSATQAAPGVSFDVDAAKRLYAEAGAQETIRVPLAYTPPEITGEDITSRLFVDKLAEMNTSLSDSSANRIVNVTLAAAACNGTVLAPGEEFSFNRVVGIRTAEKGYKQATGYAGSSTVPMVGGGICQVSSTIYYCTLLSDLEITLRRNHSLTVSYLPAGLDATVSWGSIDFKFRNNKSFPIRINAWVEEKTLYVEIWGTRESDITIALENEIVKTVEPPVEERVDPSLKPGKTKVIQKGKSGCVSNAYKVYLDGSGTPIRKELISTDTYSAQKKIVAVGPEPSEPVGPEPSEPAGPGTTEPQPTDTPPTEPGPTVPEPTEPEPTEPEPTVPEPTVPEPTGTEPTDPGPTEPDPTDTESDPTGPADTDPDDPDPDPTDEEDEGDGTETSGPVG